MRTCIRPSVMRPSSSLAERLELGHGRLDDHGRNAPFAEGLAQVLVQREVTRQALALFEPLADVPLVRLERGELLARALPPARPPGASRAAGRSRSCDRQRSGRLPGAALAEPRASNSRSRRSAGQLWRPSAGSSGRGWLRLPSGFIRVRQRSLQLRRARFSSAGRSFSRLSKAGGSPSSARPRPPSP